MVAETGNFTRAVEKRNTFQAAVVVGNIHDLVTSLVSNKCRLNDLLPSRAAADSSRCGSLRTCDPRHRVVAARCQRGARGQGRRVAAWTGVASGAASDVFARRSGDAAWLG